MYSCHLSARAGRAACDRHDCRPSSLSRGRRKRQLPEPDDRSSNVGDGLRLSWLPSQDHARAIRAGSADHRCRRLSAACGRKLVVVGQTRTGMRRAAKKGRPRRRLLRRPAVIAAHKIALDPQPAQESCCARPAERRGLPTTGCSQNANGSIEPGRGRPRTACDASSMVSRTRNSRGTTEISRPAWRGSLPSPAGDVRPSHTGLGARSSNDARTWPAATALFCQISGLSASGEGRC